MTHSRSMLIHAIDLNAELLCARLAELCRQPDEQRLMLADASVRDIRELLSRLDTSLAEERRRG